MKPAETPLQMARRHVEEGEAHVLKQREILVRLQRDELPAEMAKVLLDEFEQILEDHRADLQRMEGERRRGLRDEQGNLRPTRPLSPR